MRIATWNLASLTSERLERLLDWLASIEPDILCVQETKMTDDAFPAMEFLGRGYESAHHGQGRWNGVAILSRVGITEVEIGFADGGAPDPEARVIGATCGGVRVLSVYAPNGRSVDHEQFQYKLDWYGRLLAHLEATAERDDDLVVGGDFNVAPADLDVWDPARFQGATHVSAAEREAFRSLENWGLRDVFREQHPGAADLYTWWDYRAGAFHKGQGMRIDMVLATDALADRTRWAVMDRNARKGKKPSDHAPVVVEFDPGDRSVT